MNKRKVNIQVLEPQQTSGIRVIDTTESANAAKPIVMGTAKIEVQVLIDLLKLKEVQYSEVERWFKEEYDSSADKDTVAEWEKNGIEFNAQIKLLRYILSQHCP